MSVCIENLACKYSAPMGIKVVSASVQNVLASKYIARFAPTGIKIVLVVIQIVPTGKNLPHRLQI